MEDRRGGGGDWGDARGRIQAARSAAGGLRHSRDADYGRVSRYGLIAFASSLDRIGPLARTVRDAATVLGVMAGRDPRDSTSADVPTADYAKGLDEPVHGMRIGVPTDYFGAGLDPQVRERVEAGMRC